MSLNGELSNLFATFAALMEIRGESPFKAIAFSKVSRIVRDTTIDLRDACETGKIKEIEGIGASSCKIIEEYVKTGRSSDFDEVAASVPAGLIPMLNIPSLGPKTIALLWKKKNITNLEELIKAIDEGKLADLKGIGPKKIEAIQLGIALRAQAAERIGIVDALPIGQSLAARLRELPLVRNAEFAGSLRRHRETIGDIDLVCALKDDSFASGSIVAQDFVRFPEVQRILGQGATKASVLTVAGLQVDLRIVPADHFGAALQYFTGSKEHNVKLRGLAQARKMTLNEWGLYSAEAHEKAEKETGAPPKLKPVASKTEQDVYKALGLEWIEPELREGRGEIEAAKAGKLPRLIELTDIRGDLHSHTTASDGQNSIEEMAEAAIARGYQFLAITDHSKSQVIANGLTAERLLRHVKEIRRIAERMNFTILAGCEVDILVDGRLDFEDAVLADLDFVVASPHVSLKQDADKATDRLVRALENRYVNIIGHPTGRLIFNREGLPLNFPRIYQAAAATGTALEINASFPRLDLSDIHARGALAAGVKLSINTDAHSISEFEQMQYGLHVARRAWAARENVINCMTHAQLKSFIAAKRG
ncbi:MAG: DNA polymerase/3'-5' exonuclease PolX [Planctomycetota bacterium]|nr:DNA polymerase/3'-5' exonuclease PolX [Planctomycetota bacterium]